MTQGGLLLPLSYLAIRSLLRLGQLYAVPTVNVTVEAMTGNNSSVTATVQAGLDKDCFSPLTNSEMAASLTVRPQRLLAANRAEICARWSSNSA